MSRHEIKRGSFKQYILLLCLGLILILVMYQDHLPELFRHTIDALDKSYTALRLSVRSDTIPDQSELPVERITPLPQIAEVRGIEDPLRLLNAQAPTILNPYLSYAIQDWEAARLTYEPLASFDKKGNLVPILAEEIPTLDNGGLSADGKSVIWKLKHNVRWSDGEPFTADDVIFTYQFRTNPDVKAVYASNYDIVKDVQALDSQTIKINFKDITPAWTLFFIGVVDVILPRHVFEPYNGPHAREAPANILPVGTGPYRVVPPGIQRQEVLLLGTKLVQTNKIVYEPNPYFREADKPYFKRVEFRGGGTYQEAARLVLQEGKIDYASRLEKLPHTMLTELLEGGKGELFINFLPGVERILLNRTDPDQETEDGERSSLQYPHPLFSDKKVRQAFAYAIDRESIAELYGQAGRPTTNNLVDPPQYRSPNTADLYKFNLDRARELLDEAGWIDSNGDGIRDKNGLKMQVVFQTYVGTISSHIQQIVKKNLESINVDVELKSIDSSVMYGPGPANPDSIYRFNADMLMFPISADFVDPSAYMQFWTCSQIPQKANGWSSGLNIERWCSPEYDHLYQQSTTELDPEKRRQIFIRMNDMLIEDVVMIPLVHLAFVQGINRTIEGVDLTPWDASTWNISDWRRVSP